MKTKLAILAGSALLLTAASACQADEVFPVVHNEAMSVRILNGKDGKPQARVHVLLVGGYDRDDVSLGMWHEDALTDSEGVVHVSNALRNLPLLRVGVLKRHACDRGASQAAFSVELIRRDGVSGANRCGATVAADAPGVFTFFINGGKPEANSKARPKPQ